MRCGQVWPLKDMCTAKIGHLGGMIFPLSSQYFKSKNSFPELNIQVQWLVIREEFKSIPNELFTSEIE